MHQQLYKQIIDQAKTENRQKNQGVYLEWHHIVPEFMFRNRKRKGPHGHLDGDPNHPDNPVLLTFQEHRMTYYYLYEIHKDTRYGYQAGSALQFFFTKAGGNHKRQIHLSEVDQLFLNSMAHLREIGISSISKARKGKMPVVDVITCQSIGSVAVDHPKVLSGEWIHHSKGKPGHKNGKSQKGLQNNNYKSMTTERRQRVYDCVGHSVVDGGYFSAKLFVSALKKEFSEFKKVSQVWVFNNFGSYEDLIRSYNQERKQSVVHDSQYKSTQHRDKLRSASSSKSWVTDGQHSIMISSTTLNRFLSNNPSYKRGRTL